MLPRRLSKTRVNEMQPVRYVAARTRLPLAVVALGLTSFLTDTASEMIFPLLPGFVAALGATPTFLGLVEGVSDAVSSLLKLASGYAADRTGRTKPFVLFGYVVAAAARPCMGLATAPWHVLAVRLTDRVGKGVRSAPRDALIAAVSQQSSAGRAFGFHRAMDHAGAVVGPLVATVLLAAGVALRNVFLLAAVPGALSVIMVLLVREPVAEAPPPAASGTVAPALSRSLRYFLMVIALSSLANSSDAFLLLRAHELG
ncbi:MAG TPA: MFS transporter, partial [Polyangiales bacterium]|nr:MFS transporter [Polyangiales bacterium]